MMSKSVATSDNIAGRVATVTRSGRTVKPTEKALENRAAVKCDIPKISHTTSEQRSVVRTRENVENDNALQSVVSGLSRSTKQTSSSLSSKRSEKRRSELARAHELSVKLQYMEREEELQKQLEDINRQKRKLEIERQCKEALARAKAYDDDEPEQPVLSKNGGMSVEDRVRDYVTSQDPAYDIVDDQPLHTENFQHAHGRP